MQQSKVPGLYGISKANSSRYEHSLWGKNQFNSTFPLSLCLYARDKGVRPVAVIADNGNIKATDSEWTLDRVIGGSSDKPYYHFEESFSPYATFSRNQVDKIDLVVSFSGQHTIPLEVKLTVIPDVTTLDKPESEWGPEVVMRPVSSAHAMMGVVNSLLTPGNESYKDEVIKALKPAYNGVSDWGNKAELLQHSSVICEALNDALAIVESLQAPFLLQPIWKTKGQTLELCEQCFDVFIWSDVSIMRVPVKEFSSSSSSNSLTRWIREVARHVRSICELILHQDYDYAGIYKGMSLNLQTDKAFALSGAKSIEYLRHERLFNPKLHQSVLQEIILNGGESQLKPERRFDAAVLSHMTSHPTRSTPP